MATTKDGLAVITEKTFMEFLQTYRIDAANNDPRVTTRIKRENPQLYRILKIGMDAAPSGEAKCYYECGMQIVYELLRKQSKI